MAQNIANDTGFDEPQTVLANSDINVIRILAAINRAGEYLRQLPDHNGWTVLMLEHTFSTANGTAAYSLPSDFLHFVGRTQYDKTNAESYFGPLTPQEWQAIKSGQVPNTGIQPSYRIRVNSSNVNEFNIDPTPAAIETQVFEYVSNGWVQLAGDSSRTTRFGLSTDTTSDSDTSLIEEYLVELEGRWRFLSSQGLPYLEEKMEAENAINAAISRDGGNRAANLAGGPFPPPELAARTPDIGFGS